MKFFNITVLFASTLTVPLLTSAQSSIPAQDLQQARELVKAFGGDLKTVLKTVLKTSMKSAGPIKALSECNIQAMPIAEINSSSSPWDIARTSLKVRNENNQADEWETQVLQLFEQRKADGEAIETMEYAETIKTAEKQYIAI
jgi:hypothetical protein